MSIFILFVQMLIALIFEVSLNYFVSYFSFDSNS